MTIEHDHPDRDDAVASAWRAHSNESPPAALDAAILAAAHRAVGSTPQDAARRNGEATRPQRWWMPLAAAATIGVVAIGILQVAPQAPVDVLIGERAEVAERRAPALPAAPASSAKSAAQAPAASATSTAQAPVVPNAPAAMAPAPLPSRAAAVAPADSAARGDARKQDAALPTQRAQPAAAPAPEPFPAVGLAKKLEAEADAAKPDSQERKDTAPAPAVAASPAPAPVPNAAFVPAPPRANAVKESAAPGATTGVAGTASVTGAMGAAAPAKSTLRLRQENVARDEVRVPSTPAAAGPGFAPSPLNAAELQSRVSDPDAWIARIRKLRAEGRVAEAASELRDFRRHVPNAESRLPADLREWAREP